MHAFARTAEAPNSMISYVLYFCRYPLTPRAAGASLADSRQPVRVTFDTSALTRSSLTAAQQLYLAGAVLPALQTRVASMLNVGGCPSQAPHAPWVLPSAAVGKHRESLKLPESPLTRHCRQHTHDHNDPIHTVAHGTYTTHMCRFSNNGSCHSSCTCHSTSMSRSGSPGCPGTPCPKVLRQGVDVILVPTTPGDPSVGAPAGHSGLPSTVH